MDWLYIGHGCACHWIAIDWVGIVVDMRWDGHELWWPKAAWPWAGMSMVWAGEGLCWSWAVLVIGWSDHRQAMGWDGHELG